MISEIGSKFSIQNVDICTYLPQILVSVPGQFLGVPSRGDTLESMALGDANHVNHLILGEHSGDRNLFLKMVPGKVNLVPDRTFVEVV